MKNNIVAVICLAIGQKACLGQNSPIGILGNDLGGLDRRNGWIERIGALTLTQNFGKY